MNRDNLLRLGTRGSALALSQARSVAAALRARTGTAVELVEISTKGDQSSAPVVELGVGVFVNALRDALLAGHVDFVVHSYKDLPTDLQPKLATGDSSINELMIAAVPSRADPRDALVARSGSSLARLADGARIGTAAPRRVAQLKAANSKLECVPIRGNVDTRLRQVAEGRLDGVVVAQAALDRLGRSNEATEIFEPLLMLPAPAQGALAVECRTDTDWLSAMLAQLDDAVTRGTVEAERAMLAGVAAGCSAPVAALAEASTADAGPEMEFRLRGAVFSADGQFAIRAERTGTLAKASEIGRALAHDLLASGADTVLGSTA